MPSGGGTYFAQPTAGQSNNGWQYGEAPPADYLNWLFYTTDQWIQFLYGSATASGTPANSTVLSTTGNTSNGSNMLTSLASIVGVLKGQAIVASGVPTGTFVDSVSGTTVIMSQNATANNTTTAVAFNHQYATGANVQAQLDELDATIFTREYPYDIIVGGSTVAAATHATLAAALADANYGANQRVLLADSQNLSATVTISKAGWRISALPSVTYTNAGAGVGIIPNATGIWIEGLRMAGFTTGIQLSSSGAYCRVFNCNFNSCTLDVDDSSNTTGKIYGNITE
jgi:hypothetical protein